MLTIEDVINLIPERGIMSIIQRDLEANGDKYALLIMRHLLENNNQVFLFLYEPFSILSRNLRAMNLDVTKYLNKNLIIFDVFGSMNKIERNTPGVYTLSGYLDDVIFISKMKEWGRSIIKKFSTDVEKIWLMTYLTSGVCKLFHNPISTYKMIWLMREDVLKDKSPKTIITYSPVECPLLEDIVYFVSDIVIETKVLKGKKVGIIAKGGEENTIFELFEEV
ncbi:hypothetical protein [Pyrococcus sp. ST04]|uniref:hypothetical protein n=1 Tax=Pyrococcus sp. ST04 TaxID=1183377 RepID=UPI0002605AAD|nr:hypothetical protein [Pyrococcus sp. ST04]AFK22110.1 hypothetical protein Py04_0508 [Pyrococcus sp. ST04]